MIGIDGKQVKLQIWDTAGRFADCLSLPNAYFKGKNRSAQLREVTIVAPQARCSSMISLGLRFLIFCFYALIRLQI